MEDIYKWQEETFPLDRIVSEDDWPRMPMGSKSDRIRRYNNAKPTEKDADGDKKTKKNRKKA